MATLPPDIDDDLDEDLDENAPPRPAAPPPAPVFSDTSFDMPSFPSQRGHFYGTLREAPPPQDQPSEISTPQKAAPPPEVQTPGISIPEKDVTQPAPQKNDVVTPKISAPQKAAAPTENKKAPSDSKPVRSYAPLNEKLTIMPTSDAALHNWQDILYAHARLNSRGEPVDETGKHVINLKDMNPEFGCKLAQTCLDLDAAGHKGQFYIMSGKRTDAEEDVIRAHYASIGSDHPVGKQGWSPHVYGIATDLQFTGPRSRLDAFYADFHAHGARNGLGFVTNDPNHCQIPNAHQYIAQMRNKQPMEFASNRATGRNPVNPLT